MMIGRYKDFEIYETDKDRYTNLPYYWVWSPLGYLTIEGNLIQLKGFSGDSQLFCFPDICDIENALSIYLGEPIKLDVTITQKKLV